ncbi:MAG: GntR family transcriptional regulator [Burkholderiales bacterium RIFCSPLOWO2_02_FULL_57_36]|nr:MAG: GntR family transcriptional regulator [Burkholderiales bacterium RIFCSPLOWO2_02_FULL_57_36]
MRTNVSSSVSEDLGKLILRSVLAILILMHGIAKIMGGVDFITGLVEKFGLPPALGYLVYAGEVIAPLLVLFGLWTRPAALVIAINMIVAIVLVHSAELFDITKTGGWALELQGMFLTGAVAVALLGAGRFSIGGNHGKWN